MGYRTGPVVVWVGTLRRVPTRQVWSEARFGVRLIRKIAQRVSGIPAHCPRLDSLPNCQALLSFTSPHLFL